MMNQKDKRGVSVMIGYILLVVFAIIISVIVYQWLKSYVPSEPLECSEEISLFIKEAAFNSSTGILGVVLRNNGNFNVAGYFIHGKNDSGQEIPTIVLSAYLNESISQGAVIFGNSVAFFEGGSNSLKPGEQRTHYFNISSSLGNINAIRIVPTIFEKQDSRNRFVSCAESRTEGIVAEGNLLTIGGGETCIDESKSITCGTWVCGNKANNCGNYVSCGTCSSGTCNAAGQCEGGAVCTPDTNVCLNRQCGDWLNGTNCGYANCGTCGSGLTCNTMGQCVAVGGGGVGSQLNYFGFEKNDQGWADGDGTGANSLRSNDRSKVTDSGTDGGSWSWKISHNQVGSYTQKSFNFVGYSQIIIEWWAYYTGLESNQDDCFEIKIDNVKVQSWGSRAPACDNNIFSSQSQWISQSVTLNSASYNFDSSVQVRFEAEANNENDMLYMDGIKVTGIPIP